jgi:protein O-mannosyl-transferase
MTELASAPVQSADVAVITAPRRIFVVSILLLALASLLPGIGAISGKFFIIDDETMIYKSPYIGDVERGAKPRPLSRVFSEHRFTHYAPLHELLIYAQWAVFGFSTVAFRVVSILLHFGAALLCWQMLRVLTRRDGLSLAAALVFAVHPAQVESVSWVVEQKNLASGLLIFAALAAYFNTARNVWLRVAVTMVLMALACLFKSTALIVAPLVLLYEVCLSSDTRPIYLRCLRLLPLIAVAVFSVERAFWALDKMQSEANVWTLKDVILNLPGSLVLYLKINLLPWTTSFFHHMEPVTSAASAAFAGNLLLLLAIAGGGFLCVQVQSRRLYVFALLAYVAAIGPVFMSMWTFPAYDRFTYNALPFLFVALALVIEGIVLRVQAAAAEVRPGSLAMSTATVLCWALPLALLATLSTTRSAMFANETAVMVDAATKAPDSCFPHAAIANLQMHRLTFNPPESEIERQKATETLFFATDRARKCKNFNEYFPTPAVLLAASAQFMVKAGHHDRAESFLRGVVAEKRWSRFLDQQKSARIQLSRLTKNELADAIELINKAFTPQISEDDAAKLCSPALQKITHAFELIALLETLDPPMAVDGAYWLEFLTHERLREVAAKRSDLPQAQEKFIAGRAALRKISANSEYYSRAQSILKSSDEAVK